MVKGNRYMFGGQPLPSFKPWAMNNLGISDWTKRETAQADFEVAPPTLNHEFIKELGEKSFSRRSFQKWERIMHSHGACIQELWELRYSKLEKVCDFVVYPNSTEDVEKLVQLAAKHNVVLVPYGGGTNVTKSLLLPSEEKRMIVSVDMGRMNQIKWVKKEDRMACIQAGIAGAELERELKPYGMVLGHEPDSSEFSTLGGWIATRASGMKKNTYGNIEDIVQSITIVTPKGTFQKENPWPRVSNGPDLNHMVMGSEGNLGIVTECILRVRPTPQKRIFDSLIFHDFEVGIKFMYEVSKTNCYPTSIRLIDNTQFQFGACLKPASNSRVHDLIEAAKKFFVVNVKGFDPNNMVACTMMFEGDAEWCDYAYKKVLNIGKQFNGLVGGPENGMRGYLLTFLIAYTRDFGLDHFIAAESFETSVAWTRVSELVRRVKSRIMNEGQALGFRPEQIWCSFRVTQLYETGAAVYVYLSLQYRGMDRDRVIDMYEVIEDAARDEVMLVGGAISHHHGVGKIRKKFVDRTLPPMALQWQKEMKDLIDPQNIFAINNTVPRSEEESLKMREEDQARADRLKK
jgi:alkyldihydroxyacetonephosphate synthase